MFKKSFILITIVFLCLFFCGCKKQNYIPKTSNNAIVTQFTADFLATYKNLDISGKITTGTHGMVIIDFKSPDTIEGLEVTYKNNQTQIAYNSLCSTADEAFLPDKSMPKILYEIVCKISDFSKSSTQKKERNNTYFFDITQGKCVMTADENGFVSSVNVENAEFKIDFFNQMSLQQ